MRKADFRLWSGRYDRQMSDIFAVQREIAENVVRAIEVTLSQNERTALGQPRTADVRAYEAVREQADWASLRAVEMDPRSGQAWASRGLSLSLSGRNGEAEKAFELAIQLAPDLFEAYYFHARHCFATGQFEKAARLYEESMRVNPDDYQSPLLLAQIYDDLGRPAEATVARQRGIEVAERRLAGWSRPSSAWKKPPATA